MEYNTQWLFVLLLNIFIYGLCIFITIKRKLYTIISIRSPTLLLSSIFSNFVLNEILIIYKIFGQNFFSSFFSLFRFILVVSIILKNERIIKCCSVYKNILLDKKKFYEKRKVFTEKYYVKILLYLSCFFLGVTVIIVIIGKEYLEPFFVGEEKINKIKVILWLIWNFLEQGVLLTYIYRIYYIINIQNFIKMELYIYFIAWFIYTNITFVFIYFTDYDNPNFSILIIMTMMMLYLSLILNGYIPIVLSFRLKSLVIYHFPSKLLNNFYLFLSIKECYYSFYNYLIKNNDEKNIFFLKLYTYIIKYRLNFNLGKDQDKIFNDAVIIYDTFFKSDENKRYINIELLLKIREEYKTFDNFSKNRKIIYDEALKYAFFNLSQEFNEFKNSKEYSHLAEKMTLLSYTHCKMFNTGLIKKF